MYNRETVGQGNLWTGIMYNLGKGSAGETYNRENIQQGKVGQWKLTTAKR